MDPKLKSKLERNAALVKRIEALEATARELANPERVREIVIETVREVAAKNLLQSLAAEIQDRNAGHPPGPLLTPIIAACQSAYNRIANPS